LLLLTIDIDTYSDYTVEASVVSGQPWAPQNAYRAPPNGDL